MNRRLVSGLMSPADPQFDPMEPFASREFLAETMRGLESFEYKLYGRIPRKLHRGDPSKFEFDLNLGVIHFTELDFQGLSALFGRLNTKWGTEMTFCVYPSKERNREMILNVRGSPLAPSEID
jgi:hypothetical protein